MQQRAKDLEGLLKILHEGAAALQEAGSLLGRFRDTDSLMAVGRAHEAKTAIRLLAKDLSDGLVSLKNYAFDSKSYVLIFDDSKLTLAEEGEILLDKEITIPSGETLFDFDKVPGDFRS